MFRFEELEIWQEAISYAKKIYKIAALFPRTETYGLGDQVRRASVSISNNIAEGSGGTDKDFAKYLDIAVKSTLETVNCLRLANEFGYITDKEEGLLYSDAEVMIKRTRAFKKSFNSH